MSRRTIDPVDRAFDQWRGLTTEQQQQLADRQYGFRAAQGRTEPIPVRVRKPAKKKVATAEAE